MNEDLIYKVGNLRGYLYSCNTPSDYTLSFSLDNKNNGIANIIVTDLGDGTKVLDASLIAYDTASIQLSGPNLAGYFVEIISYGGIVRFNVKSENEQPALWFLNDDANREMVEKICGPQTY